MLAIFLEFDICNKDLFQLDATLVCYSLQQLIKSGYNIVAR